MKTLNHQRVTPPKTNGWNQRITPKWKRKSSEPNLHFGVPNALQNFKITGMEFSSHAILVKNMSLLPGSWHRTPTPQNNAHKYKGNHFKNTSNIYVASSLIRQAPPQKMGPKALWVEASPSLPPEKASCIWEGLVFVFCSTGPFWERIFWSNCHFSSREMGMCLWKVYDFWLYIYIYMCVYILGTQMTLVLNGKGLLPKIEDKRVPGIHLSFDLKYTHRYGDLVALF